MQVSALHGAAPRGEEIVPMTWVRRRIAERLVEAKNTAALVTTFNEVDMSAVIGIRQQYRDAFQQRTAPSWGSCRSLSRRRSSR